MTAISSVEWDSLVRYLERRDRFVGGTFRACVGLDIANGYVTVAAPNEFTRDFIAERRTPEIETWLKSDEVPPLFRDLHLRMIADPTFVRSERFDFHTGEITETPEQAKRRIKSIVVPPRFHHDPHMKARSQSQQDAMDIMREAADLVHKGEAPMILLIGEPGTGKSTLLWEFVKEMVDFNHRIVADTWLSVATKIKAAKRYDNDRSPGSVTIYDKLIGVKACCLDEMRPSSGTDFDSREVANIITELHKQRGAFIGTSNTPRVHEMLQDAVLSRLTIVRVEAPDYRTHPPEE